MSSLFAVLARQTPLVEDVALAIASDVYPGLSHERYRDALDHLAGPLRPLIERKSNVLAKVELLTHHVYGELGFRGNELDYYDPRNSYLNEVIDRRLGIPITLAVVLIALGRRLGIAVHGVAFPGHFLVRVEDDVPLFLDPFHEGQLLARRELQELAARVMEQPDELALQQLDPVGPRVMAVRMLFNLQQIYERRGDHANAMVACDRLVDLTDAHFYRRDRGIHALALGAYRAAVDDFEHYLAKADGADDEQRIRDLLAKANKATDVALH
jgi:regulator of sirC expression with transglutaminase-like and TPR domain